MRSAVVLLSGGLDSATSLAWTIREGFESHALTVRYGQRHDLEVARASALASRLGAREHRVVPIDLAALARSALTDPAIAVPKHRSDDGSIPSTYVPARNTVFLALALAWGETIGARDLVIGVNAVDYSGYPDCRPAFLRAFEALAREGTKAGAGGETFRVHAPLVGDSKAEIVRKAVAWGVPLELTLSCYDPSPEGVPCGACDACAIRRKGFLEAGLDDPAARR